MTNRFRERLDAFVRQMRRRRLDAAVVFGEANIRSLTGVACDNACLLVRPCADRLQPSVSDPQPLLLTDFRYAAAIRREAPWLKVGDLKRLDSHLRRLRKCGPRRAPASGAPSLPRRASASGAPSLPRRAPASGAPFRIGCEFTESHDRIERLRKMRPRATFVDIAKNLSDLRAVKTSDEIERIRAAERVTCEIWRDASAKFRAGMTEREMARIIRKMMIDRADGESFETIVCIGANAAECHHVPDDTVWNGREPILVDMGVKLSGYCGDLTRNILPQRSSRTYRRVHGLVAQANRAAITALKPGMTAGALDRVARKIIASGGFGKCFGHSLGHGVGLVVHEAPTARKGDKTVLGPGMLVTIEPGIYLEGNLGVRIEDLVLVTETGCEVLSASAVEGDC